MQRQDQIMQYYWRLIPSVTLVVPMSINCIYAAEVSYLYAGDERIARKIDHATIQTYIVDKKGSVLQVVEGAAQAVGISYQYDAYGMVLKSPAMDIPNPFQYNGEWTDEFIQLQYLRARFYHPKLMRFVQQDSYDLANRFNYGDGNPIVNSDPSGHMAWDATLRIAGDEFGVTAGIVAMSPLTVRVSCADLALFFKESVSTTLKDCF